MCGFIAVGGHVAREGSLHSLVATHLGRRGPDGVACKTLAVGDLPVQLGHAQFDVRDRSGGAGQPMGSASGRSLIVFNGEIYNYPELAAELGAPDGGWRTRSDTELLLEGLEREGVAFLERTNGMFALVFCRLDLPEVLMARDRLGIRPLYYTVGADSWAIGSTVRAVLAAGVTPFELSADGLESFLTFGSVYEPHTIAERVRPLPPGTWRRWRPDEGWTERTWWELPEPTGGADSRSAGREMGEILLDAVAIRTRSEYPIGAFVSGGTDSSSIAIMLSDDVRQPFSSLSLAFEGPDLAFSEARYQRRIAERCGSTHHELVIRQDNAFAALDDFFDQMDQPTIDGFNIFLVCREAARLGVRTCLSGTGGDEVFAGYGTFASVDRYQTAIEQLNRLSTGARAVLSTPLSTLAGFRPLEPRLSKPAYLVGSTGDLAEYYALRRAVFLPSQVRALCGGAPMRLADGLSYRPRAESGDGVNLWSTFELGNYLRNTLLRDGDVFSMAHAVEMRVPMLDHRLVERALQIDGRLKVSPSRHKPLLQAALDGRLPGYTWDRCKTGFTLPIQEWLRQEFIPPPDLGGRLDTAEVREVFEGFRRNPSNRRSWSRLWALHALDRSLRRGYGS